MEFKKIEHGSVEYWQVVQLRRVVLRFPLGLDYTPEQLTAEVSVHHFAAFDDGVPVACAGATSPANGTIQFKQVAVDPERQGSGLGRQMMEFVEAWAREKGFEDVLLHARETAVPFYERIGYVAFGEVFLEVGIPHKKMRKQL